MGSDDTKHGDKKVAPATAPEPALPTADPVETPSRHRS